MKLSEIVSVAGIPGLHKIVGRTKTGLILESLNETQKRFPTGMQDKVSVLDDISMYTLEGEMKLSVVFQTIHNKGDVPMDAKSARQFLIDTIQLESERVYDSDIKKLITWYHILKQQIDLSTIADVDVVEKQPADTAESDVIETQTTVSETTEKKKTTRKKAETKTEEPAAEGEEKPKRTRKKKTDE